jgi:hypothetical protein
MFSGVCSLVPGKKNKPSSPKKPRRAKLSVSPGEATGVMGYQEHEKNLKKLKILVDGPRVGL